VNGTTYVVGGYDGTALPASVLSTTDGQSFRPVGQLNPPVRYPAVAARDGAVFVFGGKTATGQTDAIQRIDPTAGTVTTVGHLPTPIGHAVAFVLGDTIYVAGGRAGDATSDAAAEVSATIWAFDPATGTVQSCGTLPYPIADTGVTVVADHAYFLGGETDGADTAVATVIDVHR
jgi:N-acetylneuraminic acid mutarotase